MENIILWVSAITAIICYLNTIFMATKDFVSTLFFKAIPFCVGVANTFVFCAVIGWIHI